MNKSRLLFIAALFVGSQAQAQFSDTRSNVYWPDTVQLTVLEWVDLDNDSLLDVLALGRQSSGETSVFIVRNTAEGTLHHTNAFESEISLTSYCLIDLDEDHQMDLVLSGRRQGVEGSFFFRNLGDFGFGSPVLMTAQAYSFMSFADLYRDGENDWLN